MVTDAVTNGGFVTAFVTTEDLRPSCEKFFKKISTHLLTVLIKVL